MEEKCYKIYKYTNKINGKVYIGQTRQSIKSRAQNGWGYKKCPYFASAIKSYGWDNFDVEVLKENLTQEEADKYECEYIKYYKDLKISYNIHKGGKSKGKHLNSLEIRKKISKSMTGKNSGKNNGMYGKDGPKCVKVYEFNTQLELVKTYKSICEAANHIGIQPQTLSNHLKNSIVKYDKHLFTCDDCINNHKKVYELKKLNIKIYQYDLNGNLIKTYNNINHAIRNEKLSLYMINKLKNGPSMYKNFIWSRSDNFNKQVINRELLSDILNPNKNKTEKVIYKYDMNCKSYEIYNDIKNISEKNYIIYNLSKKLKNGPVIYNHHIWTMTNDVNGIDLAINATINSMKNSFKTPVFQFNINGDFIKLYESLYQLKEFNIISVDSFKKYIKNGSMMYKNSILTDLKNLYPLSDIINRSKNNKIKEKQNMNRPVIKLLNGVVINEIKNVSTLAKLLNINRSTIIHKLQNGSLIKDGYHYTYK